jgi:hypothetical protein
LWRLVQRILGGDMESHQEHREDGTERQPLDSDRSTTEHASNQEQQQQQQPSEREVPEEFKRAAALGSSAQREFAMAFFHAVNNVRVVQLP